MVRALANYLPIADLDTYVALGGAQTFEWATKAILAVGAEDALPMTDSDEILILGLPYGGPKAGKDSEGEFFSPMSNFMDGVIERPAVMYTHGTSNGFEAETVGDINWRGYNREGGWFKVKLDPTSSRYPQLKAAYAEGKLYASTSPVTGAFDINKQTGHIDTWLVGELSLVDTRSGYVPVNKFAVAKATVDKIVFDDYYGDPVREDRMSLSEAIIEFINSWRLSNPSPVGEIETVKVTVEEPAKAEPDTIVEVQEETDPMPEKCLPCEEAARLRDEALSEIAEAETSKCQKCPEAVTWVRTQFKAGKLSPAKARQLLDEFVESDERFEAVKAELEKPKAKAQPVDINEVTAPTADLYLLGGTESKDKDPQAVVDMDFIERAKRQAGMHPVNKRS